jgi:hypothetical protein
LEEGGGVEEGGVMHIGLVEEGKWGEWVGMRMDEWLEC